MFKGGGLGSPLIFVRTKFCQRFLAFWPTTKNLEAQLKIPLNKISAKFSFLAFLKISCKNIENGEGVGKNVKSIFTKSRTEILAILWIFGGFYGIKWLNWTQFSGGAKPPGFFFVK